MVEREITIQEKIAAVIDAIKNYPKPKELVVYANPIFFNKLMVSMKFKGWRMWREAKRSGKTTLSRKDWMKLVFYKGNV